MPITGLFFLPPTSSDPLPAQDLIYRLRSAFDLTPLPPWALSQRLFRETPSSAQSSQSSPTLDGPVKSKPTGQRLLQILSLSHHTPRAYVAITAINSPLQTKANTPTSSQQNGEVAVTGDFATIISIPTGSATEEFTQLVATKFGPLWQPRQALHVMNGSAFEVGDFRVRIGELKQGYGAGGTLTARGAVCEIEWLGLESINPSSTVGAQKEDWKGAEPVIRGFWETLEVKGAREVFWVSGLGDGTGSVRQWCEILRLRSQ